MQAVFVCGGRGSRLAPRSVGPKSLVTVAGTSLLARLVSGVGALHRSAAPPVVIVDARDAETPSALKALRPDARIIRQPHPDGVANALLLAERFLDDLMVVTLGDLFLDGAFAAIPRRPGLAFWREAPAVETHKNFGISTAADGRVSTLTEKPTDLRGLRCGMGVYVLTRSAIACFHHAPVDRATGERGITGAIQTAIDAGVAFETIPFSGFYSNVNSHSDLMAVERHVAHAAR
jgi:dTDP-glucose pyrophosphorylase